MKNTFIIKANRTKWFLLVGLTLLFATNLSMATHMGGGEITYEWVSGNTYTLRYTYYSDCAGIPPPISVNISYTSSCFPQGIATLTPVGSSQQISPICAASLPNSSCNGGSLYAIWRTDFEGTVTLGGPCVDWLFEFTSCCRNASVTNLVNPASYDLYVSSSLNNLDVPFNNSAIFAGNPLHIINNNTTTSINWHAFDIDGDSIVFELINARGASGISLPYAIGLSGTAPFQSSNPTTIDMSAGIITVSPNALQTAVVAMKISEYRVGILVGEICRDYQIAVVSSSNNLPELTGINGTNAFIANVCPGNTLSFDVFSSDPDPGQTLNLNMSSSNTGAGFSSSAGLTPTGTFTWSPGIIDINSQPYMFAINVNDDNCDYYGSQTYVYQVYVNGCNTNDVWPGDANSDGVANVYDLLAIGLAWNDNGPVRPAASTNWISQPCPDWTNTFVSGINHKHADTDGNGIVNLDDTTAIMLNYGLNHPLRNQLHGSFLNVADLSVTANYDTVGMQTAVNFDIALSTPVDSIYGLAFRLYFDPSLVDISTTQVTYAGSMFGTNGVNMVKIDKTIMNSGFVDIALSRIDLQNINGSGNIVRVTIVTTDNVSGKFTLNVEPFDVEAVTAYEFPVTINTNGDEVVIDPNFVGVYENTVDNMLTVHPVPANDIIHFELIGNSPLHTIKIYDMHGKEVLSVEKPNTKTDIIISQLTNGVYYLSACVGEKKIIKKIVKL